MLCFSSIDGDHVGYALICGDAYGRWSSILQDLRVMLEPHCTRFVRSIGVPVCRTSTWFWSLNLPDLPVVVELSKNMHVELQLQSEGLMG